MTSVAVFLRCGGDEQVAALVAEAGREASPTLHVPQAELEDAVAVSDERTVEPAGQCAGNLHVAS